MRTVDAYAYAFSKADSREIYIFMPLMPGVGKCGIENVALWAPGRYAYLCL